MNKPLHIFNESRCLSQKELSAYHLDKLDRQSTHRVEEHLVDCELCSNALAGLALVPFSDADVQELHAKIDARTGKGGSGSGFSPKLIVASITALAAVGTVFFYGEVFNEPVQQPTNPIAENHAPALEEKTSPALDEKTVAVEIPADIRDKEVVTKKASTIFPKENFTEKKVAVVEEKKNDVIAGAEEKNPLNAQPMNPADKKEIPQQEEPVVEPEYNAKVDYMHDLKVTDLKRFYYKDPADLSRPTGNVPSPFESKNNMDTKELVRTQDATDILKKGLLYFKDQNFRRANEQFAMLIELNKNDVNALFYSGLSYYNSEKPELAIKHLDRVLLSTNNVFHMEAQWYKALALLKKKDNEKAKEVLNEIVKGKGFYAKQAKEKLK